MKETREKFVAVRFSKSEIDLIEELRQRTDSTTYPRMIRTIIINIARSKSFDFLVNEDPDDAMELSAVEEKLMLYELVESKIEQLEDQNIILSRNRQPKESDKEEDDEPE